MTMPGFNPPCICGHERRDHVQADQMWCVRCPIPPEGDDHPYQPDYLTLMNTAFNRRN